MDRRRRISAALIGAAFAIVLGVVVIYVHGIRIVDPHLLDQEIGEKLPAGSDQAHVMAFLESKKISHSDYAPEYHQIQAQIGRSRIGLGRGRIIIKFYFDEHGRLERHTVRELLDFL